MKCNLAAWDRLLRFLLAIVLITYALAGGPTWAWIGLFLLFTSAWGICPIFVALKIKTLREPNNVSNNISGNPTGPQFTQPDSETRSDKNG